MAQHFNSDTERITAIKHGRRLIVAMLIIVISNMAYTAYKTFF